MQIARDVSPIPRSRSASNSPRPLRTPRTPPVSRRRPTSPETPSRSISSPLITQGRVITSPLRRSKAERLRTLFPPTGVPGAPRPRPPTPNLGSALRWDDFGLIQQLVTEDFCLVRTPLRDGELPLERAARLACAPETVALLQSKLDKEEELSKHSTAALFALCKPMPPVPSEPCPGNVRRALFLPPPLGEGEELRRLELARLLLQGGANWAHRDDQGFSAEQYAISAKRLFLASYVSSCVACAYLRHAWRCLRVRTSTGLSSLPELTIAIICRHLIPESMMICEHLAR